MPTFSKKHYELVAKAIAKSRPPEAQETQFMEDKLSMQAKDAQWKKDVETLAEAFADDNPSFNEDRFTTAVMDMGREPTK